jgi:hypothetical protein
MFRYKNGVEIFPSERVKMSADDKFGHYKLTIPETLKDDEGAFRVVLSDAEMSVESSAKLVVRGCNEYNNIK